MMFKKYCPIILLVALIGFPILFYSNDVTNTIEPSQSSPVLSLNVNKPLLSLRETVNIYGTLEFGGLPVAGLIAVRVFNSIDNPVTFRTISTGSFSFDPLVDITEIVPCEDTPLPPPTPTQSLEAGEQAFIRVTVRNYDITTKSITVAVTIYDGSMTSLVASSQGLSLDSGSPAILYIPVLIPPWARIGGATVVASIFSTEPSTYGMPHCFEESDTFNITRGPGTTDFNSPNVYIPSPEGSYNLAFKLSPESRNGEYTIDATGKYGVAEPTSESTTFQVQSTGVAPQASFTFVPAKPYVNQTVSFDASASSAEGYADEIIQYEWNFGDLTSPLTRTTPTATHKFSQVGTYIVTLNVTDTEGLWCTTAKPITIQPPVGPTANFTWSILPNFAVRFDASISQRGWNGTGEPPIVSYEWSFGDGNITTVSTAVITHHYLIAGNYSVTLTVTDTQPLQDSITQEVSVTEILFPRWDINQDGFVNAKDAIILGVAFGSETGDPEYNPAADINVEGGDGFVNAKDAVTLGTHFGESY